jgi:hypothetical protein
MDISEDDGTQQPDPLKHPDLPLQYLAWVKANTPEKAAAVERTLHESGWLERRKQYILKRNEAGRATDDAKTGFFTGERAINDLPENALKLTHAITDPWTKLNAPITGTHRRSPAMEGKFGGEVGVGLVDPDTGLVTKENTKGAITPREFAQAGLQTTAMAVAPAVSKLVGSAAARVAPTALTEIAAKALPYVDEVAPALSGLARSATRVLGAGASGGVVNSTLQGTEGLVMGDENNDNRLRTAYEQAKSGFKSGVVGGAGMGVAAELAVPILSRVLGKVKVSRPTVAEEPPVPSENAPVGNKMDAPDIAFQPELTKGGVRGMGAQVPVNAILAKARQLQQSVKSYTQRFTAPIEDAHPAVADAMNASGASGAAANHIEMQILPRVVAGLDDTQIEKFGQTLARDTQAERAVQAGQRAEEAQLLIPIMQKERLAAKRAQAAAKTAKNEEDMIAARQEAAMWTKEIENTKAAIVEHKQVQAQWENHALNTKKLLGDEVSSEPWFQSTLEKHNRTLKPHMDENSLLSGVDPDNMLDPATAYVKMYSKDRMLNNELARGQARPLATDGGWRRSAPARFLLGNPHDEVSARAIQVPETPRTTIGSEGETNVFQQTSGGRQQGPLTPEFMAGGGGVAPKGEAVTGSARHATGSAREYETDYPTIMTKDAVEKIRLGRINNVYEELKKSGMARELEAGQAPQSDEVLFKRRLFSRDETGKIIEDTQVPMAVKKEIAPTVGEWESRTFNKNNAGLSGTKSDNSNLWKKVSNAGASAAVTGNPSEAIGHMTREISHLGLIPGELDMKGKLLGLVSPDAAAIREAATLDFTDPYVLEVQDRLGMNGGLRLKDTPLNAKGVTANGGALNLGHRALFGPQNFDDRVRTAMALRYLKRKPDATNGELVNFANQVGNYVAENAGKLTNVLQEMGFSNFARFQMASVQTGARRLAGISDLPTNSLGQKAGDVASTLWRGTLGSYGRASAMNKMLTGHWMHENPKGYGNRIATGYTAHAGGFERDPSGDEADQTYVSPSLWNPVISRAMRSTTARNWLPSGMNYTDAATVPERTEDAVSDLANTHVLGKMGPALRAVWTAFSGRAPYANRKGLTMQVADKAIDPSNQWAENVKAALERTNFVTEASMAPNPLVKKLEGGGSSTASQVLRAIQLFVPRPLELGKGRDDANISSASRQQQDYQQWARDMGDRLVQEAADDPAKVDAFISDAKDVAEKTWSPQIAANIGALLRTRLMNVKPSATRKAQTAREFMNKLNQEP